MRDHKPGLLAKLTGLVLLLLPFLLALWAMQPE